MPELPEVEVIRRGLARHLVGRRFLRVMKGNLKLRQEATAEQWQSLVTGRRLVKVGRRGKYLLLHLEGGTSVILHLGMTGRLLICGDHHAPATPSAAEGCGPFAAETPALYNAGALKTTLGAPERKAGVTALPHVHLRFMLEGDIWLLFQDARRFGQAVVCPTKDIPTFLAQVGVEPFSRQVTPEWLLTCAQGRHRPLKNFLMDGRFITGLGNIYASEIMFAARLHPTTPVGRLTRWDWHRLIQEMRRILRRAIRQGGTTVNDYLHCDGQTGLFQLELMVYGRAGQPCYRCRALIQRLVQAGRSTFFCPVCQPTEGHHHHLTFQPT